MFYYTFTFQLKSLTNVNIYGESRTGGLVGVNNQNSVVENSYVTGNVPASEYVGGLVGWNYRNSKISNSYASVSVNGNSNIGGLLGIIQDTGVVSNSYYDKSKRNITDSSDRGIGKDYEDMKNKEIYINWDFDKVWTIKDDINNGYPTLQW